MTSYFVIYQDEDGGAHVEQHAKHSLEQRLRQFDRLTFVDKLPDPVEGSTSESDLGGETYLYDSIRDWRRKAIIIKGEIVLPKPIKTVDAYEIP